MAAADRVFSPPTPRRVRGADLDLAVYECGRGGTPTIVLVHGYPDNHTVWGGVAAALSDRFHVVTYDVRGAGASDAPAARTGYRIENLAADLEAVIEATSADRPAHVVGHDWGSIQAWEAVTDERIARHIASFTSISGPCLDHVGHWLRESLSDGAFGRVLRQALRSWYVGFFHVPRLPERLWQAGLARTWPRMLARTEGIKDATPVHTDDGVHGLELYRANVPARLLAPQLRSTNVPVQVIVPRGDRFVTPSLAQQAARWAPKLSVREVEGGHWVVRSAPVSVAGWIADLVDEVEG
jgi:pimeloyl-ACP methyl ester carboxylesterase